MSPGSVLNSPVDLGRESYCKWLFLLPCLDLQLLLQEILVLLAPGNSVLQVFSSPSK